MDDGRRKKGPVPRLILDLRVDVISRARGCLRGVVGFLMMAIDYDFLRSSLSVKAIWTTTIFVPVGKTIIVQIFVAETSTLSVSAFIADNHALISSCNKNLGP